ncbi:MAG TPA: carboxypeptidase-like regulatory domain-containing protein [Candidatus Angelobacter sp.]|nr:carboxypeptidase-like regulatory domain-containing protein [Candidatus Angelobacter sp.]
MQNRHISALAQPQDLLRRVQVASPCTADWEQMAGDDRIRHCPACNLNVYNLSAMTVREAAHLVSGHQGRLCVRYYRRADGTILTQDCPRGAGTPVRRVSRLAGAALSAAMTVTFAAAQTPSQFESKSLVQIDRNASGIIVQVTDANGAIVSDAQVTLLNRSSQRELKETTDSSGNLRLLHLPAGSYRITVSSPGFENGSEIVALDEQQITTLNVTLNAGATQGEIVEIMPMPMAVVDSVSIPLEPVPTAHQEPASKKPLLKRMFSGVRHKLGF